MTTTYKECVAARKARVERAIAERQPWETVTDLAEKAGVSKRTIEAQLQSPHPCGDCNSEAAEPDIPTEPLMAMAGDPDPEAAHEAEKTAGREREAIVRSEAKRAHARDLDDDLAPYRPEPYQPTPTPRLSLVPKVDPTDEIVALFSVLSPSDKSRAFERQAAIRAAF